MTEGRIAAEEISSKGLIDHHYAAIADYALRTKPADLPVTKKKAAEFQEKYGVTWDEALSTDMVLNAASAMELLGKTGEEFTEVISKAQAEGQLKLAPGLYCVRLADHDGKFVINGFYEGLRSKFVQPGTEIYYFVIKFATSSMTWEYFRGQFIGATNPSSAEPTSIRGEMMQRAEELGTGELSTGNNGVHASAGALEGLRERLIWTHSSLAEDPFGRALLDAGISRKLLHTWLEDNPAVKVKGKEDSIFNHTEEMDSTPCVVLLQKLDLQHFKKKSNSAMKKGQAEQSSDEPTFSRAYVPK